MKCFVLQPILFCIILVTTQGIPLEPRNANYAPQSNYGSAPPYNPTYNQSQYGGGNLYPNLNNYQQVRPGTQGTYGSHNSNNQPHQHHLNQYNQTHPGNNGAFAGVGSNTGIGHGNQFHPGSPAGGPSSYPGSSFNQNNSPLAPYPGNSWNRTVVGGQYNQSRPGGSYPPYSGYPGAGGNYPAGSGGAYPAGTSGAYPAGTGGTYPGGVGGSYPSGTGSNYPAGGTGGNYPSGTGSNYPSYGSSSYPSPANSSYPQRPAGSYPSNTGSNYPSGTNYPTGTNYPSGTGTNYPAGTGTNYPSGTGTNYPSGTGASYPSYGGSGSYQPQGPQWNQTNYGQINPTQGLGFSPSGGQQSQEFLNCISRCGRSFENKPVCGTNQRTYPNLTALQCEKMCGAGIQLSHQGACSA